MRAAATFQTASRGSGGPRSPASQRARKVRIDSPPISAWSTGPLTKYSFLTSAAMGEYYRGGRSAGQPPAPQDGEGACRREEPLTEATGRPAQPPPGGHPQAHADDQPGQVRHDVRALSHAQHREEAEAGPHH